MVLAILDDHDPFSSPKAPSLQIAERPLSGRGGACATLGHK